MLFGAFLWDGNIHAILKNQFKRIQLQCRADPETLFHTAVRDELLPIFKALVLADFHPDFSGKSLLGYTQFYSSVTENLCFPSQNSLDFNWVQSDRCCLN